MRYLELSKSQRQKVKWWYPGAGKGRMWSYCLTGAEFPFCKMERVLDMDDVMAAQKYKCAQCHLTVYLKMVWMVNIICIIK